jgi:alpha-mannosidase
MHRKRKGVFCAKSFANAKNNGKDVSVIRDNSDRYFIGDIDKNTLGTVLINSIVRTEGTWEVDINDDIEAVGNHDLKYKVLFGKPSLSILDKITPSIFTSDIARENPPVSNKLPPYLSLFDISVEDGTQITSITNNENGLTIRLAQTTGQTQKVIIPANGYNACTSQLFSGEKVLEIEKANDSFTYTLKPFEIITLKLK